MTGPCSQCGEDHGRSPKHWRDERGNLYLFCSDDCRREFIADYTREHFRCSGTPVIIPPATPKKASRSRGDLRRRDEASETKISKAIGDLLDYRVDWNSRIQSNKIKTASGHYVRGAKAGTPDRVAAAGLMLWLEVKKPGEQATPDQVKTMAALRANGSLTAVVESIDDVNAVLYFLDGWKPHISEINGKIKQMQDVIDDALEKRRKARAK